MRLIESVGRGFGRIRIEKVVMEVEGMVDGDRTIHDVVAIRGDM
jgi:hypothetical protein